MAKDKRYVVCPGRSCSLPLGAGILTQGQAVPEGIEERLLKEWESTGFIRRVGGEGVPDAAPAVVKTDGSLRRAQEKISVKGKFNHDPEKIKNYPLERLNTMLADLNQDPVQTEEEAIALLSADRGD